VALEACGESLTSRPLESADVGLPAKCHQDDLCWAELTIGVPELLLTRRTRLYN